MINTIIMVINEDVPDLVRSISVNFQNVRIMLAPDTICGDPECKRGCGMVFSAEVLEISKRLVWEKIFRKLVINCIKFPVAIYSCQENVNIFNPKIK